MDRSTRVMPAGSVRTRFCGGFSSLAAAPAAAAAARPAGRCPAGGACAASGERQTRECAVTARDVCWMQLESVPHVRSAE